MIQLEIIRKRIFELEDMLRQLDIWKFKQQKIVFTNGCFDILHPGHIEYLSKAADLGDKLVVGINTDKSVKRIKEKGRPIITQELRALQIAALHFVDAVIFFDDDTPENLIKAINPNVLVKGADYSEQDIVGADFVKKKGGEVERIKLLEGFSTSILIDKIKSL